jgi:hypothetical protein
VPIVARGTRRSHDIGAPRTTRVNRTYRHEALLWHDADDFLAATVPFITEGLAAEESIMVAVTAERTGWLRDSLGADASRVLFVDMVNLARNPARIIPAWRRFLDEHSAHGDRVRGIGEPVWPGRRAEEIAEAELHEGLLNVAVDPDTPFWLICPYDVTHLPEDVIEGVHRSHPAILTSADYRGSHLYAGREHVSTVFATELAPLDGTPCELTFARDSLAEVADFVAARARAGGVAPGTVDDLVTAVAGLAASSLQRGAEGGVVRVWSRSDALVCELHDELVVKDPMTGRKLSSQAQRNGLWVANQLCDLVQLRSTPAGTTVRVHHWL